MYEFIHKIDGGAQMGTSDSDPEPRQQYEVHCGQCGWWGMLDNLKVIYKSNPHNSEDVLKEAGCPMCLSDQWLEHKEANR